MTFRIYECEGYNLTIVSEGYGSPIRVVKQKFGVQCQPSEQRQKSRHQAKFLCEAAGASPNWQCGKVARNSALLRNSCNIGSVAGELIFISS